MEIALFVAFVALVGALATAFGADTRSDADHHWPGPDRPEAD